MEENLRHVKNLLDNEVRTPCSGAYNTLRWQGNLIRYFRQFPIKRKGGDSLRTPHSTVGSRHLRQANKPLTDVLQQ